MTPAVRDSTAADPVEIPARDLFSLPVLGTWLAGRPTHPRR
ncbi:hypothetical protein [Nonomuraea sp. NPDC049684]